MLLADSLLQIRGPRQPDYTNVLETQRNNQSLGVNALGLIPEDESRTSRLPVYQPVARNVSFFTECEEYDCRTQLALQIFPPQQYPEHPDGQTNDVSLRRVCLAVIG